MTETTKEDGRAPDRDAVLRRLKKLLALASDSAAAPGEAENAMRMAQNLMAKHGLEEGAIYSAELTKTYIRSTAANLPPPWEGFLMNEVCRAFGGKNLWVPGWGEKGERTKGVHLIIVPKRRRELVEYAFDVLRRGLVKARAEFIRTLPYHWTRQRKADNGDRFGVEYVRALSRKISDFALDPREAAALEARKKQLVSPDAEPKEYRSLDAASDLAAVLGAEAGAKANLNRPMKGHEELKQLEN